MNEMKNFESELADMIKDIKFQMVNSRFQQKLRDDVQRIQNSTETFVSADKTQNFYKISKENHHRILRDNVTKTYKKSRPDLPEKINADAKKLATHYKVADKIDKIDQQQCFLTIN